MDSNFTSRCFCSPTSQCSNGLSFCISSVGCFYSADIAHGTNYILHETFGCISNETGHLNIFCLSKKPKLNLIKCCSSPSEMFCNLHLKQNSSYVPNILEYLTLHGLAFSLAIPILIFVLISISIIYFYFYGCRSSIAIRDRILSVIVMKLGRNFGTGKYCYSKSAIFSKSFNPTNQLLKFKKSSKHNSGVRGGDVTSGSGSGSGAPFLVRQTVARQITLDSCIGKGRFGEVWRAVYQGDEVAVKVFSSRDEASWARETEIYNTGLLYHPNLLAYYASDMFSHGGCTQLWLITAYHQSGCLFDFLRYNRFSLKAGLRIARSAAAGLAFLHTDIPSFHLKPAIAHRDIKSKNILIMLNGEVCIADLGLALLRTSNLLTENRVVIPSIPQSLCSNVALYPANNDSTYFRTSTTGLLPASPLVGTKRYMAPELLSLLPSVADNHKIILNSDYSEDNLVLSYMSELHRLILPFEAYQAADVYALGLVFWEIARRTEGASDETFNVEDYQMPYEQYVPDNPTFRQMYNVVVLGEHYAKDFQPNIGQTASNPGSIISEAANGLRPPISHRWKVTESGLGKYTTLIQECWHPIWSYRLSALRIRKTMEAIEKSISNEIDIN